MQLQHKHGIIAFQMDFLGSINIKTDSSFLLALEFQNRGYELFFYQVKDLYIENGKVGAKGFFASLKEDEQNHYEIISQKIINLEEVLLVMIRQDPPFDMNYITSTYLLEKISGSTLVLNNPASIRNLPEKLSPLIFKNSLPDYIISSNFETIKEFAESRRSVVLKPIYQHGGQDIALISVTDSGFDDAIKNYIERFGHIIVQRFIEDVKVNGDKRVIFVNDEVLGVFRRFSKPGDFRTNTALGGSFDICELTEREISLCKEIGLFLKKNDILFAGIDILNEQLIEINITSPTGLRILNKLYNKNCEKIVIDAIETKLNH